MFGSKKTPEEKAAATRLSRIRQAAAAAGVTAMGDKFRQPGQEAIPIEGSKVTIELGEVARKRITATRVALIGPFAVWAKKEETQLFITIEHEEGVLLIPVSSAKEAKARIFATIVNGAATGITTGGEDPAS